MSVACSGITESLSQWKVLWGQPWVQVGGLQWFESVGLQEEESVGWGTGVNWKDRGPQEAEREIKMTQHPVPTAQPGVSLGPDHLGMCPPHLGREKGKLGWL